MSIFKKGLIAAVVALGLIIPVARVASAYDPAEYTGNGQPQFNTYTSVLNFGNEKDFFRVGPVNGTGSQYTNQYELCDGTAQFNVYVHNGAPEGYNGTDNNGSGVARDTKLAIDLQTNGKETSKAVISASNAASVSDTAAIRCGSDDVTVEYDLNSAMVYGNHIPGGKQPLSNAVVKGGTLIGTYANDGKMSGCWDQRVYVTIRVKVKKVVKPAPKYTCDLLEVVPGDNRTVRISNFKYTATNGATFKNVTINWGDSNSETFGNDVVGKSHQYAKDGTYTIAATARFTVNGAEVTASGVNCVKQVTYNSGVPTPPVTPAAPTELFKTGPGSLLGIFMGTTVVSAVAYRFGLVKKLLGLV